MEPPVDDETLMAQWQLQMYNQTQETPAIELDEESYDYVPWPRDLLEATSAYSELSDELDAFVGYIQPSQEAKRAHRIVHNAITNAVIEKYPNASVAVFGSSLTNTYLPDGDLDISIQIPGLADGDKSQRVQILRNIEKAFKDRGIVKESRVLHHARVPIITLKTSIASIDVDISLNNHASREVATLTEELIKTFNHLLPCLFATKLLAKMKHLNKVHDGGVNSISLFCLVASFFQLQTIEGDDQGPGPALMCLWHFYSCVFNWEEDGVSIVNGGSLFKKVSRGAAFQTFLAIQDILHPEKNLAAGSYRAEELKHIFDSGWQYLYIALDRRQCEIALGNGTSKLNFSLLGSSVRVSLKMMKFRAGVVLSVSDGRLAHLGRDKLATFAPSNAMTSSVVPAGSATMTGKAKAGSSKRKGHRKRRGDNLHSARPEKKAKKNATKSMPLKAHT